MNNNPTQAGKPMTLSGGDQWVGPADADGQRPDSPQPSSAAQVDESELKWIVEDEHSIAETADWIYSIDHAERNLVARSKRLNRTVYIEKSWMTLPSARHSAEIHHQAITSALAHERAEHRKEKGVLHHEISLLRMTSKERVDEILREKGRADTNFKWTEDLQNQLGEAQAQLEHERAVCKGLVDQVKSNAETFRYYAELHRAKGPSGEQKALANEMHAADCDAALAATDKGEG